MQSLEGGRGGATGEWLKTDKSMQAFERGTPTREWL